MSSPTAGVFAPTLPNQASASYSEASLWGIEEEDEEVDILESFRRHQRPTPAADDLARAQQDREYWERELDVKMVFNYLTNRFSSRPTTPNTARRAGPLGGQGRPSPADVAGSELFSARRAALIRQHHPLVSRAAASSASNRRRDLAHRHHYHHAPAAPSLALRNPVLRSGSSCASQSTKKSKRSGGSGRNRNFWDMSGSVGSGSVVYGEV